MSNSINLASLGFGGIDTSTLVTSLVAIEQQPVTAMQTQAQKIQSASTTLSSFSTTLGALANAASTLSDPTTFAAMKATSSDSSVVATASGAPIAGQWSVSVSSIAQQQRTLSSGQASSTAALGLSGTLGISLGNGTTANVTVSATDTLSNIATAINSSGLRVQAGVSFDGSQYHLLVSGLDTGASNAITFDESALGGGPALGLSAASSTIQKAQDANLTVGGVSITSATNQITNAIPGVTLAVTQPTTAPATISIAGDSTGLQGEVQTFVDAYNAVVSAGHTDAGFGTTAAQNALLQGDQSIHAALDQMAQIVGGVGGSSGAYTTLASVGITLNDDGTLAFNTSTFATAVQADPTSVTKLFSSDATTGSKGLMGAINTAINALTDPTTGGVQAEIGGFSTRSTNLAKQITNAQARITAYQTQLQKQFTQMNTLLQQYKQTSSALNQDFNQSSSSTSTSTVV
jgi:flagellar hook-associated protein 2